MIGDLTRAQVQQLAEKRLVYALGLERGLWDGLSVARAHLVISAQEANTAYLREIGLTRLARAIHISAALADALDERP